MGAIYNVDDIYISSQFDLLNLRFAPPQDKPNAPKNPDFFGGIEEMVALQKEFQIFKIGRTFSTSAKILNVGGSWNRPLANKLYLYLDRLHKMESNVSGKNGNDSLVDAMIKNLESKEPLPVYFEAYDSGKNEVVTLKTSRPIFYIERDYLTISLPMKPMKPNPRP